MGVVSKELFYESFKGIDCKTVVHPNFNSCSKSFIYYALEGVKGTGKFYFLFYLIELLARSKRSNTSITRDDVKRMLKCFLLSTLSGGAYSSLATGSMCLSRNMFGEFKYYFIAGLGGFVGGLSIFIEDPSRRGFPTVCFLYLTFEMIFRYLNEKKYLPRTKYVDTIMFMVISSVLSYLLRIVNNQATYLWIFTPPKFDKLRNMAEKTKCPHRGSCWEDIIVGQIRYFLMGLIVQWIRSVIQKFSLILKQPTETLKLEKNHLKMGLFAGLYVTIYKSISCSLCQLYGRDSPTYAIPSAIVAGVTYLLKPDFTVVLIALSNVFLVAEQYFKYKKCIPNWPISDIAFALSGAFLFHSSVFCRSHVPKDVLKLMSAYTNGRTEDIYNRIASILYKTNQTN